MPYWIHPKDNNFFALAGLWDEWEDKRSGDTIISSAIITTEPNEMMKPIHDRMPIILSAEDWKLWLDPVISEREILGPLLQPFDSSKMEAYEVSTYANSPQHNDRRAIEPAINSLF